MAAGSGVWCEAVGLAVMLRFLLCLNFFVTCCAFFCLLQNQTNQRVLFARKKRHKNNHERCCPLECARANPPKRIPYVLGEQCQTRDIGLMSNEQKVNGIVKEIIPKGEFKKMAWGVLC